MNANDLCDKKYYELYSGMAYEKGNGWEEHFDKVAEHIVKEINPKTVLDVGCAEGFLVQALRKRGVEAYGIDISEYAIADAPDDVREYCKVASVTEPLKKNYDLIVSIEVLEHLSSDDLPMAMKNICEHSNDILFSSTSFDYDDETYINVKPIEKWVEFFFYQGFMHVIDYDASYISIQAMRLKKQEKTSAEIIKEYERIIFCYRQELIPLRAHYDLAQERIRVLDAGNIKHGQEIDTMRLMHNEQMKKMDEEYRKKEDFLRKECGKKLESILDENSNLKEINIALRETNRNPNFGYGTYGEQLKHVIENYEGSTCWKLTKPIRAIGDLIHSHKK